MFDKGLWLFCKIFLDEAEIEAIKLQITEMGSFQFVYLDPDVDQRRKLTNRILTIASPEEQMISNCDCFLKKSVNFLQIDMDDYNKQKQTLFLGVKKVLLQKYNKYLTKFVLTYENDTNQEYTIPLMLIDPEEEIELIVQDINEIVYLQDEFFLIRKMNFQMAGKRVIQFEQFGFDLNQVLKEKKFLLKRELKSLHVLYQEDVFAGFFVVLSEVFKKENQQILKDEYIIPADFDHKRLDNLKLRFDLSFFDMEQFKQYK